MTKEYKVDAFVYGPDQKEPEKVTEYFNIIEEAEEYAESLQFASDIFVLWRKKAWNVAKHISRVD